MFIKTTIALALILATASGALAAPKKHSTGGFEAYGAMGTDPDSRIRGDLLRSAVSE